MGTMYRSKDSRSSKFTSHAAVQLQRRHNPRYDGAAAGQLLEELNGIKSVELKRLIHKTFPTMYGMYMLREEEMRLTDGEYCDKELNLYHVTTKSRALESLKNGLDWRRTRRFKFWRGVSFSDDADYANYYADKFTNEGEFDRADTTVSSNGRVYVKYNDYDFYPLYFIYYQRRSEHLDESKYFYSNPHNKWHQNNRALQQQQLQEQRKREQAQLAREQARRERKRVQRARQRAQRRLERDDAQQQRLETDCCLIL